MRVSRFEHSGALGGDETHMCGAMKRTCDEIDARIDRVLLQRFHDDEIVRERRVNEASGGSSSVCATIRHLLSQFTLF